jgi:hypothetical protein
MKGILQSGIPESEFRKCWENIPPYQEFIDAVEERISNQISDEILSFTARIQSSGSNRVRIDGSFKTDRSDKDFYIEMVWMPSLKSYRGTASISDSEPEPPPKTVGQLIKELDRIINEKDVIIEGQIFNALEGVDTEAKGIKKAYAAIFRLFERFPEADTSMHGHLVQILEEQGIDEKLLLDSINRTPSVTAIQLVHSLIHFGISDQAQSRWLEILLGLTKRSDVSEPVIEAANEIIERYF